jgi:hypothetical protein
MSMLALSRALGTSYNDALTFVSTHKRASFNLS